MVVAAGGCGKGAFLPGGAVSGAEERANLVAHDVDLILAVVRADRQAHDLPGEAFGKGEGSLRPAVRRIGTRAVWGDGVVDLGGNTALGEVRAKPFAL